MLQHKTRKNVSSSLNIALESFYRATAPISQGAENRLVFQYIGHRREWDGTDPALAITYASPEPLEDNQHIDELGTEKKSEPRRGEKGAKRRK